ncbi:hypothetical protein L9F63_007467 [Diploptera punctata]|uniref:Uncharacterized protein n=1 Tax=Diploptera punctata TaxID=6984 RepID=A0AAD7Z924_DIPPU|nr:hypothetical protein L9F63_007467 [Diploptera punctata]
MQGKEENATKYLLDKQLCRLCALPREDVVYIFSDSGHKVDLQTKINTWLPTQVSKIDCLPKQVCNFCIKKLDFCVNFGKSCLNAEQILNNMMQNKEFRYCIRAHEDTSISKDGFITLNKTGKGKQLLKFKSNSSNVVQKNKQNAKTDTFNRISSHITSTNNELEATTKNTALVYNNKNSGEALDKKCDYNDKMTKNRDYSCPLCYEGIMLTVEQSEESFHCNKSSQNVKYDNTKNDKLPIRSYNSVRCNEELTIFDVLKENINDTRISLHSQIGVNERGSDNGVSNEYDEEEDLSENKIVQGETKGTAQCKLCGINVKNLDECLVHALKTHGDSESNYFPCPQCGIKFLYDTDLNGHFTIYHQKMKLARLLHICTKCGWRCISKRSLESHTCAPVNSSDQLSCKKCRQTFSTKEHLKFHSQFHNPDAHPLKCAICGIIFKEEESLYDHVKISHQRQSYICNDCGQHFESKNLLRTHVQIHKKLSYKCEVCDKIFFDEKALMDHSVCHKAVKQYQCHICGKQLNRSTRLKVHIMSHEIKKTIPPQQCYECKICGETLSDQSKATDHIQTEHKIYNNIEQFSHLVSMDKVNIYGFW